MVWHGPAPGLLAQARQTRPGCPWQAPGSPALLSPVTSTATTTVVQVWDKGTLSAWFVPAQPVPSSPCRTGSIVLQHWAQSQGQWDSPVRATHFPPVPYPLVAGALRMPGARGDWDPRALGLIGASVLVTLDTLDMGVPGGARTPSLCCYQGCQGSHGCWGYEGDTYTWIYPYTCVYTHQGCWGPRDPGPRDAEGPGGPGGFGASGSFQRSCGS